MNIENQKTFSMENDNCCINEKQNDISFVLDTESSTLFVSDQTPTPSKLIKNCEEIGLFDDLKHVNPFDEIFRRAIQEKDTEDTLTEINNGIKPNFDENSLNTPQIVPHDNYIEKETSTESIYNKESCSKIITKNDISNKNKTKKSLQKEDNKRKRLIKPRPTNLCTTQIPLIQKTFLLPNTINIIQPSQLLAVGFTTPTMLQTSLLIPNSQPIFNNTDNVKNKLREHLKTDRKSFDNKTYEKNNNILIGNLENPINNNNNNSNLERKRAAATRYRLKINKERVELQKRNKELLAENKKLKFVINELKKVLEKHVGCDITPKKIV